MSRIANFVLTALLGSYFAASLSATEVIDTSRSKFANVQPMGLSEVHWTEGFWADRFATCRDSSVPAMWELMKGEKYKPYYKHFLIAAGDLPGRFRGAAWNDGDFYKWIEAACSIYAVQPDPDLLRIIDQCVLVIGRAQRADGYLHTPVLIRNRNGDATAKPFQDRHNFEMYNMGHLITTACLHHRVTGKTDLLAIAEKTAGFFEKAFENPTPELARNSVCPSHYMAVVELYRTTQDERYLKLAEKFLAMRSLVKDGGDDNQDRVPFVKQREALGHAVRANYLFAGAADLYMENGDPALRESLEAIWSNVTTKKIYVTGGCGALYDGASPDGTSKQSTITRIHQAYGRNYQLPNLTAYNETCATIGNVLWNWRMFLATGEARYIDVLELSLYNSVLSGVSLEGTDYFYVNPLRNEKPLPSELRWARTRVPFVTSYCCPPNVVRTIAQASNFAYAKQPDAILVNVYGGNRFVAKVGGEPLELTQVTNYPWDGTVELTVDECPTQELTLKLRIPGWAEQWKLQVNDKEVSTSEEMMGYVAICRKWKAGDVVTLDLPMPVQLMESHPFVEETRNQLAVKRGPIVYCLESSDLPADVRVRDLAISPRDEFRIQTDFEALNGVAVLETSLHRVNAGPWENQLYRPISRSEGSTNTSQATNKNGRSVKTRLIPYFAWSNRGESEMSVWLPRKE